jgi:PDZ domain
VQLQSRRCLYGALMVAIALGPWAPSRASGEDPGTIGLYLRQLYDEQQPSHRGALAVMRVVADSPADRAGIHCSDFVIKVNEMSVLGREYPDIMKQELRGAVGTTVRLTVLRFDGSQSEIALVRTAYPPHLSSIGDPFAYQVPGSWSTDPRYFFPLPWWPKIPYQGFEDIFFSPNFDETNNPEYHSFLFFLWLEGSHLLSAAQLQRDMLAYFRGIAEERGRMYGFVPDVAKVSATYKEDSVRGRSFGGAPAREFSGAVTIWDTHGTIITLNSEVLISGCGTPDHTAFFVGMSREPRDGPMWKKLDAIRDSFRCSRPPATAAAH